MPAQINAYRVRQQDLDVPLPPQDPADGRSNIPRRQRCGGDLIQQGLEQVMVSSIDDGHIDRFALERTSRIQAAEPAANDDYVWHA